MNLEVATLSDHQKKAIRESNKPINIWHGSVRSGKTYSSLIRFLIEISEAQDGEMACVCRDAFAFRRNILPLIFQLVGNDARYLEGKGLLELWGRRIHVIGAHDTRAEGKIRGATFRAAYVDEASLIPESAWVVLVQRCAMGGAKIFATTNPDSPSHYIKKDFLDDNLDVAGFHFTMYDNPILTDKERGYLSRQHKGLWYKRFVLGEWVLAEGAVFDFFDEKVHVIEKQPSNAIFYLVGVDVGFTNPTAFTMVGYNPDASPALWVEKEYIWNSKEKGSAKTDSDYAQDLALFCSTRQNIKFIFCDPAAAGFKVEMRRSGLGIPTMDAKNDVLDGIRTMSSLIANGDLKILSSCKNLIGEMQSYCWDPKASQRGYDAPLKHNDHLTDSLRYAIYSYFGEKITLKQPQVTPDTEGRSLGNRGIGPRDGGVNMYTNINDFDHRNSVPDMSARRF